MVAASLASGCGAQVIWSPHTSRTHPDLLEKANKIDRVIILPLRVEVFLVHASGVKEKMDEWTEQAKGHVMEALEGELRSRSGLLINTLSEVSLPKEVQSNLEETQALFDVVDSAIYPGCSPSRVGPPVGMASEIAILPYHVIPEKFTAFSYTLGSEIGALDEQADALVLVRGVDHITSVGNLILQAVGGGWLWGFTGQHYPVHCPR